MEKMNNMPIDGQLDIFSLEPIEEKALVQSVESMVENVVNEEVVEETLLLEKPDDSSSLITFRPFSLIEEGNHVEISQPVDKSPESEGYFSYHKGRKGIVISVKENLKPQNENYQFYATVRFKNGEEGIFYDSELLIIE